MANRQVYSPSKKLSNWADINFTSVTKPRHWITEQVKNVCDWAKNHQEDELVLEDLKRSNSEVREVLYDKLEKKIKNARLSKLPQKTTIKNYIRNAIEFYLNNKLPCSSAQVTGLTDLDTWLEKQEQEQQEEIEEEEEEQQAQEQQSQPVHTLGDELSKYVQLRKEGLLSEAEFVECKRCAIEKAKAAAGANRTNS
tara:strand:- start:232 stop:819 length:588 start_codon:yes stop_codon:yes gene_type:complete